MNRALAKFGIFLGEFWWIFGVFRGACDLFVNIFQKLRALL
jgi:hypothetical protein